MSNKPLYTIGHGNRKPEHFLSLLNEYDIHFLIDVRSQPYSKFNPQFNQIELAAFLQRNHIRYVFMGDTVGGRPKDRACYDIDGKVNYETVKTTDFFKQGIDRLKKASTNDFNVALMCAESNPCEYHRSKLIGRVLHANDIQLQHIDENGKLKDQITVINEVNKGRFELDLFGNPIT